MNTLRHIFKNKVRDRFIALIRSLTIKCLSFNFILNLLEFLLIANIFSIKLSMLKFKIVAECYLLQLNSIPYWSANFSQLFKQGLFIIDWFNKIFVHLKDPISIPINYLYSLWQKTHNHIHCYIERQKVKVHGFKWDIDVSAEVEANFLEMREDAPLLEVSGIKVAHDKRRKHFVVICFFCSEMPFYSW